MAYIEEIEIAFQELNNAIANNPEGDYFSLMKAFVEVVSKNKGLEFGLSQASCFYMTEATLGKSLTKDQYSDLKNIAHIAAKEYQPEIDIKEKEDLTPIYQILASLYKQESDIQEVDIKGESE